MTSVNLWNCHRTEIHDVDDTDSDGKSYEYRTQVVTKTSESSSRTGNEGGTNQSPQSPVPLLNVKVTIPLKHFSIF